MSNIRDCRSQICFVSLYVCLRKKIVVHQDSRKRLVLDSLRTYAAFMLLKVVKLGQFILAVPHLFFSSFKYYPVITMKSKALECC